jgi:hypothetical protein
MTTKRKIKKTKDDKLLEFAEGVEIVLITKQKFKNQHNVEANVSFSGYLLDLDDYFFYIGNLNGMVHNAVPRDDLLGIEFLNRGPESEDYHHMDVSNTPELPVDAVQKMKKNAH